MTDQHKIIAETEEFVFELFKKKLPDHLVYHTFSHSKSVAKIAQMLGDDTELGDEGIEVVVLAALLHDTGYTEIYIGHEEVSIRIAKDFLRSKNCPENTIGLVAGCIGATKVPQTPRNVLEEIVADADLATLGKKSFSRRSELLRIEWEHAHIRHFSNDEWLEQNIKLLSSHKFFTRAAQERFEARQAKNLRKLYQQKTEFPAPPAVAPVTKQPNQSPEAMTAPAPDLALLMMMVDKSVRLIEVANRKAQFFLVANIVLLLIIANDALRVGHTSIFGKPYILFAPAFLLSMFSCIRALTHRTASHVGQLTVERTVTELEELENTAKRKEVTNNWAIFWFMLGMVVGIITHVLIWFYPHVFRY
ncbi:MAG TPA: HD domain-containing protein [Candidatus Kapabacteria bacterium]|nr:HD domain-containing protein [Candidatus Kapabacteria bacterium]